MTTWIQGENGNRASVERWGSEEVARESLTKLKNCYGCSDCSNCYGCSGCYGCSDCSDCSRCSGCSGCSDCYGCSGCSGCSRCSGCSGCSDCYGCSGCSGCSGCYGCYGCSDCSRCSDFSPQKTEPIAIPVITNIHKKIYEAASAVDALNMDSFHACDTTHCRAGWAVHLTGKAGYELEKKTSSIFAAMQIYKASGYEISPVRFFDDNDTALADMKRLAETDEAGKVASQSECFHLGRAIAKAVKEAIGWLNQ